MFHIATAPTSCETALNSFNFFTLSVVVVVYLVGKAHPAAVSLQRAHDRGQPPKEKAMETIWDWVTVIAFGGLVVLMLNRSAQEEPQDHLAQYLPPAAGCAIANYIGNNYNDIGAVVTLALVAAYVYKVLKWPPAGYFRRDSDDNNTGN